MDESERREIAAAVRDACLRAAQTAYEEAGLSGLCQEGRWELAVDAMRSMDIDALLAQLSRSSASSQSRSS